MDFTEKFGLKFGRPGRAKNRRFKYVPRYYDEDMEDLEYRVDKARRERDKMAAAASAEENLETRMRKAMEFRTESYNREYNSMNKYSGARTILIAGILLFIFYLIFSSDLILRIFDAFSYE